MDILKKQFEFCGIDKYHALGFKGKNITILNHEEGTYHARLTKRVLQQVAPEATIIESSVGASFSNSKLNYYTFTIDGVKYTPEEMYNKYKPDILSVSFSGSANDTLLEAQLKPLIDKGLIVISGTGNDGAGEVTAKYKNIAVKIGAAHFTINNNYTIPVVPSYSSYDTNKIDVDFAALTGTDFGDSSNSGTSFAAPFFAGQVALLFNRFGRLNQDKLLELLKKHTVDIVNEGIDNKSGFGIVKMPEKIEVVNMEFKDTKEHWARKEIEKAVNNNILNGYPDGTFKPEQTVTRAEMAVIIKRILEKVGK